MLALTDKHVTALQYACMWTYMYLCVFMSLYLSMWVSNPSLRTQSSNEQEQERLDERLENLQKQKELVTQQRDLAEKLQYHINVPEMRWEPRLRGVVRTMDVTNT